PSCTSSQLFSSTLCSTRTRRAFLSSKMFLTDQCVPSNDGSSALQASGLYRWLSRTSMSEGTRSGMEGGDPPKMMFSPAPSRWLSGGASPSTRKTRTDLESDETIVVRSRCRPDHGAGRGLEPGHDARERRVDAPPGWRQLAVAGVRPDDDPSRSLLPRKRERAPVDRPRLQGDDVPRSRLVEGLLEIRSGGDGEGPP